MHESLPHLWLVSQGSCGQQYDLFVPSTAYSFRLAWVHGDQLILEQACTVSKTARFSNRPAD
jgi:hypothetical protein